MPMLVKANWLVNVLVSTAEIDILTPSQSSANFSSVGILAHF